MVSLEAVSSRSMDDSSSSSPRISFSADSIGSSSLFITINPAKSPNNHHHINDPDFEFLSSTQSTLHTNMITADELFAEGKLLPFWQVQKLNAAINLNHPQEEEEEEEEEDQDQDLDEERRILEQAPPPMAANVSFKEEAAGRGNGWIMEEDPSPRPPNCTVLFKELLRLKKQRRSTATLSPSSSTSSSSSSLSDVAGDQKNSTVLKRVKKGSSSSLERTRSATIRIRPMVNLPICTPVKTSNVLPPLFPTRKGRLGR